ncbi:hypothetical protein [Flavobacterium sp.]|uniref:hypothetical protein n=1 Tax=Flavobacterium sp. TaxID=239 RepID=UPI0037519A46
MLIRVESRKSKVERKKKNNKKQEVRRKTSQNLASYFLLLIINFYTLNSQAQCAMCRASLESTGNVSQAEAVNDGIIYLMIIPYVLVGLIAFAVYRMYRKKN